MLQTGSCNTAVEESQMSRVMWYLWPATEGAAAFFLILGQGENPPREREGRTKVLGPLGCSGYYAEFLTFSGRSSDRITRIRRIWIMLMMYVPVQVHVRGPFYFLRKKMQCYLLRVFYSSRSWHIHILLNQPL